MWTPFMGREDGWDKTSNAGRPIIQGIKETKQRNRIMTEEDKRQAEEKRKDMNNAKGCMGLISFGMGCYAIYLFIHSMGWI
jgi:hypothetical protein